MDRVVIVRRKKKKEKGKNRACADHPFSGCRKKKKEERRARIASPLWTLYSKNHLAHVFTHYFLGSLFAFVTSKILSKCASFIGGVCNLIDPLLEGFKTKGICDLLIRDLESMRGQRRDEKQQHTSCLSCTISAFSTTLSALSVALSVLRIALFAVCSSNSVRVTQFFLRSWHSPSNARILPNKSIF